MIFKFLFIIPLIFTIHASLGCDTQKYLNNKNKMFDVNQVIFDLKVSLIKENDNLSECLANSFNQMIKNNFENIKSSSEQRQCSGICSDLQPALNELKKQNNEFKNIIHSITNENTVEIREESTCLLKQDQLNHLTQLGITGKNLSTIFLCCGEDEKVPGAYLSLKKDVMNYNQCIEHFKKGVPTPYYENKFGALECLGSSLDQIYNSLKDNISGLWDFAKHPIASTSELLEFGKLLLDDEGRTKIFNLIKTALNNKVNNLTACMNTDEKNEELCKMTGSFVANFIPPALLIKSLLTTMKTGKMAMALEKMADKTAAMGRAIKTVALNKAIKISQKIKSIFKKVIIFEIPKLKSIPGRKLTNLKFTRDEIISNSKLSDKDRIAKFQSIVGKRFSEDQIKAILRAHNQPGKLFQLNFSQIKSRVRILKEAGLSDEEIRAGLDAGIFGSIDYSILNIAPVQDIPIHEFNQPSLKDAKVLTHVESTKFDSGQTQFLGDNNGGIEILELNGEKIFSKIKYPLHEQPLTKGQIELLEESLNHEAKFAKILSDLDLGPKFKGVYKGNDGRPRIATQYIDGFEVHLGERPEQIKELKLATIYEMKEMALKAVEKGLNPFDLQYRIDKNGKPFIIDPEHFSFLRASEKAEVLEEIENDFKALLKQKLLSTKTK